MHVLIIIYCVKSCIVCTLKFFFLHVRVLVYGYMYVPVRPIDYWRSILIFLTEMCAAF